MNSDAKEKTISWMLDKLDGRLGKVEASSRFDRILSLEEAVPSDNDPYDVYTAYQLSIPRRRLIEASIKDLKKRAIYEDALRLIESAQLAHTRMELDYFQEEFVARLAEAEPPVVHYSTAPLHPSMFDPISPSTFDPFLGTLGDLGIFSPADLYPTPRNMPPRMPVSVTTMTSPLRTIPPQEPSRIDSVFCEHANEVPALCPCPPHCYCKANTCATRETMTYGYSHCQCGHGQVWHEFFPPYRCVCLVSNRERCDCQAFTLV